ncbi:MAG: carboxypeptidase regulatory-like domain-containing protein [Prevotella sp.]|nr:carboxypeptidase regulatory-like domain-containing protein [Prevotella sp.]
MKKFYLLFSLLALLMGTSGVKAIEINNYSIDFNSSITVPSNNHSGGNLVVSAGWTRIADRKVGDNYYDESGYYMLYSYESKAGVDNSGALLAKAQQAPQSNYDGTIETTNDYIVTPKVNGTVTLMVKASTYAGNSTPSSISFFKVDDNASTIGESIEAIYSSDINTNSYVTATLTLTEATRIAIRAQWMYMDNFTATTAIVPETKSISISSLTAAEGLENGNYYVDANSDGSFNIKYSISVKNTGNVNLTQGETNYSISCFKRNDQNATLSNGVNIPYNLAVDETSDEFVVDIPMPASARSNNGWGYYDLLENLSSTTTQGLYTYVVLYDPKPFFIKKGDEPTSKTYNLSSVSTVNFGMIGEATTLNYEIFAHNAGNLTIKSITVPEGFAVAPAETLPFTITAHTGMYVDVTANATASASGNMVITYVDKDGNDATMNVALNQTVVDASKWLATFDDNQWPANTIHQSSTRIYNSEYSNITYAVYSQYSYSNKFFTPLLQATDGEEFKFEARLSSSSGSIKVYLTKDRSSLGDPVLTLTNSDLNTSSFVSKSITAAAADNYYVVFEIYLAYIDNLYGFEKVDVDHDIMINSYKIGSYAEDKEIQTGTSQEFNLEVMPANDEAADAYSVKLYANNEVVATADATALTSGTSKTFKMNWTPVVTSTTVFATYAALEFTDGTTIASTPLNLTVKCEPVFVFFNAGTQVYSYQPSNRTTPITFGKVNKLNQVQNFEIYNYGKANLTVKSITVPEGFSVNVASATVEPAARQAVDITFSATEIGTYSGDLSIVYVDANGEDQTFTLAVSGTLLDPTKWYATFDNPTKDEIVWPKGAKYLKSIEKSTSSYSAPYNYYIYCTGTTNNIFITPKLVATANEKITFDAKKYSSYATGSKVVIWAATSPDDLIDPESTSRIKLMSTDDDGQTAITTDFQTYEAILPTAGEYIIGFEISNRACVDEIYGLTLAEAPAFEIINGKADYPETAMQNNTATITAHLQNVGMEAIAAGSYKATITIHKDGTEEREVIEVTDLATIPVDQKITIGEEGPDCSQTITIPFKPHLVGENLDILLELDTNDGTVIEHYSGGKITVTEEVASGEGIQVGTQSSTGRDYGFVDWYNTDGSNTRYTDILYTASKISASGIKAGDKITAISFKASNNAKTFKAEVTSWVSMSTGTITYGSPNKQNMTEVSVYNGTVEFPANVESVIDFSANPIIWDGISDIRVYTEAVGQGSGNWMSASYAYDNEITMSYNGSSKAGTIAYFHVEAEPTTATGTVTPKSSDVGIGGATVTFYNAENDVKYSTKTGDNGEYSVPIIQSGLSYTATVTKEGYLDTVEDVQSFDAANNFKLLTGFILDETAENEDIISEYNDVSVDKVIVNYTAKAGWNTIVLPFEITGLPYTAETKVYELVDYVDGSLRFVEHTTGNLEANTPYVFYVEEAQTEPMEFEDVAQVNVEYPEFFTETVSFIGTYSPIPAGDMTGWYGVVPSTGRIAKAGSGASIKALRAYFVLEAGTPAELNAIFTDAENIDTAIEGISIENGQLNINGAVDYSKPVYNLSGQRVGRDYKGVVIQNGKKIVVK